MLTASVVLYCHRPEEIRKVVYSILAGPVSVLYLVDHSPDDSLRILEKSFDRIRYIHRENQGYGNGHNVAIREAMELGSDYHVVVNPDIYFGEGVLEGLQSYAEEHPEIGLLMPKVLYPDGSLQYLCKLLPTPLDLMRRRFLPRCWVDRRIRKYELRFSDYDSVMRVPSLSGCFMFLRMSVLRETGCFDERYFMYAEDLDLCRRIGQVSETVYYPLVYVYHVYEQGSYKDRKLLKYHIRSMVRYFNKWGWFRDSERRRVNRCVLEELKY